MSQWLVISLSQNFHKLNSPNFKDSKTFCTRNKNKQIWELTLIQYLPAYFQDFFQAKGDSPIYKLKTALWLTQLHYAATCCALNDFEMWQTLNKSWDLLLIFQLLFSKPTMGQSENLPPTDKNRKVSKNKQQERSLPALSIHKCNHCTSRYLSERRRQRRKALYSRM